MNKLEREILDVLTADCRCPAEKVAVMVGEEKEQVESAIRAMELVIPEEKGRDAW